jgi:CheY-like chemotaxis protein
MKKVLIADHLKELFRGSHAFLERADVVLYSAETNDELLSIHRKEHADVIITRLEMRGMKLEELFATIMKTPELREVGTLIVCEDTLVNRNRCKRCNVNMVFTEPVDVPMLLMTVQRLMHIEPRMSYRAPLAIGIQGKFKTQPIPLWTENISSSGMLMRAVEPLSRGDGIFFSFHLSSGKNIAGYGEIVRAEPATDTSSSFFYGIKFTNVSSDDRKAIADLIGNADTRDFNPPLQGSMRVSKRR